MYIKRQSKAIFAASKNLLCILIRIENIGNVFLLSNFLVRHNCKNIVKLKLWNCSTLQKKTFSKSYIFLNNREFFQLKCQMSNIELSWTIQISLMTQESRIKRNVLRSLFCKQWTQKVNVLRDACWSSYIKKSWKHSILFERDIVLHFLLYICYSRTCLTPWQHTPIINVLHTHTKTSNWNAEE